MNTICWQSPLGKMHLAASEQGITALAFSENWDQVKAQLRRTGEKFEEKETPLLRKAVAELREYFEGKRTGFSLPLDLKGTDFQRQAWEALRSIPYGSTLTYREQALAMKRPKAMRAVGSANGRNPVCILIPCHRVIGANGSLTGYAGGIAVKKALLEIEAKR